MGPDPEECARPAVLISFASQIEEGVLHLVAGVSA
jgi:hypothetical protein